MKEWFKFKSFRKNFVFLCILLILIPVSNYFNKDFPLSTSDIVIIEIFLFIVYFIACSFIDLIIELQSRQNASKLRKENAILTVLRQLRNFQRTFIPVCCLLAILSANDYFNRTTTYTIGDIIKKDVFLFLLYFIACFLIDLVIELQSRNKQN